ncbi:MAG: hypothetical protein V8R46_03915 [Eubacterium ramulus]
MFRDELEKAKKQASVEGHSHEEEGDDKKNLAALFTVRFFLPSVLF